MSTFAENMKPSAILGFNQKISKIPDLIKLTIGEPDFTTPEHIKKAAVKVIEDDHSH